MNRSLALLTSLLLLAGCQTTHAPAPPAEDSLQETSAPVRPPRSASFKPDTLYSLLVAELAGQREQYDLALRKYIEQARQTRDPAICERAYRVAEYVGNEEAALESAQLWAGVAPENIEAQRAAAIQLASAGRAEDAMDYMEAVLRRQGDTNFDFLALTAAQLEPEARAGLLDSFERLLQRHPENSQLIFGRALLLQQDQRTREALSTLEATPLSRSDTSLLLLRAHLLDKLQRSDEVMPLLADGVRQHPDEQRLRQAYARQLVEQQQFDKALEQFRELQQRAPEDDDLRLSLAMVAIEARAWDEARTQLQKLLEREVHTDAAHLHLGRLAELRDAPDTALQEYAAVGPGSSYLNAQARLCDLRIRSGNADEAIAALVAARSSQPDYALQLYMLEIEKLVQLDRLDEAWRRSTEAVNHYPDDLNLRYSRAMLAEKRDDLRSLESNLRLILEREPDNSMALNALGYTLADRTTRYDEARELIERAYAISPEDPAILDSLGWVNFRLGQLEEAEKRLHQALDASYDAEIATHLGEVQWARGQRDDARTTWKKAFAEEPGNRVLRETLQRLTGRDTP